MTSCENALLVVKEESSVWRLKPFQKGSKLNDQRPQADQLSILAVDAKMWNCLKCHLKRHMPLAVLFLKGQISQIRCSLLFNRY